MTEQEINPFDASSYSTEAVTSTETTNEATQTETTATDTTNVETTATESTESTQTPDTTTATESTTVATEDTGSETREQSNISFEWESEVAKEIYDNLTNGNISDVADILYEQKVLSELDNMEESDILKLKIAYDYPELTPDEIQEEFASKYLVDKDFDESLMTDAEIAAKNKQLEKQEKAIARELKKDVREAKDYLQTLKQDISFPDILSQFQEQSQSVVNTEDIVSQYLKSQEEEQSKVYQEAREVFEKRSSCPSRRRS